MSSPISAKRKAEIDQLRGCLGFVIAYRVRLAELGGSVNAGLLLSQLLYWSDKGDDKEGWIFKSQLEWRQELYFSRRDLESARELLLQRRLIDYELRKCPPRGFYRVNLEVLFRLLKEAMTETDTSDERDCLESEPEGDGAVTCEEAPSSACTSAELNRPKTPNQNERGGRSYKEAETTEETTSKRKHKESVACATASAVLDPRHEELREHIEHLEAQRLELKPEQVPWNERAGNALSTWLADNPCVDVNLAIGLIDCHYASPARLGLLFHQWIRDLWKYKAGPINQYGLCLSEDREWQREMRLKREAAVGLPD